MLNGILEQNILDSDSCHFKVIWRRDLEARYKFLSSDYYLKPQGISDNRKKTSNKGGK